MTATTSPSQSATAPAEAPAPEDAERTGCVVVGAGPAGAVLAFLLARQGIPTTLLEEHRDFRRDFRGDTLNPAIMELMDELGLADRLLHLPHAKAHALALQTAAGPFTVADFRPLKTRFPYVTLMPQERFLDFITGEAARYPAFRLVMGANVQALLEAGGVIRGVRYRQTGGAGREGWREVRAPLTVGADGRFSRVRRLAGFTPVATAPPMDVLWFRLPRRADEPEDLQARIGAGRLLIVLNRGDYWQAGYVIPKGSYQQLRAAGLPALRAAVGGLAPEFADRLDALADWKEVSLLSVESSRLRRWYRPGLLLIGDAAHVMSPVGGVGINYAIQDAAVAANVLGAAHRRGRLRTRDLASIQARREAPTRAIQAFQAAIQRRVVANALDADRPFALPAALRLPALSVLPARLVGFGIWPVHLDAHITHAAP